MARRSVGTGARTPTATPPGARPAGPCRSGPAPARPPWRRSAARVTIIEMSHWRPDERPVIARHATVRVLAALVVVVVVLDTATSCRWSRGTARPPVQHLVY